MSGRNEQTAAPVRAARASHAALAFVLPILMLAPFANKAINFDDPCFVWVAQQIREAPLDFFGSVVDQGYKQTPMYAFNHNPPGVSYYLAFVSLFFGWEEVPLHLGMNLFAGMAGAGVYMLASRLCARPLLMTLTAILTPAFFVSASSLMTDVPMLAFYVWAVYAWVAGLEERRNAWLAAAAVAVALSALCKYYGITAVPLLLAYGLLKRRRLGAWAAWLLIPVAVLAGFQVWTWRLYGSANLLDAANVALNARFRVNEGSFFRPPDVLIFLGGSLAPLALHAPRIFRWRAIAAGLGAVILLMLPAIEGYSALQLMMGITERLNLAMTLQTAAMLGIGLFAVSLVVPNLLRRRDAETALLALWLLGTLVFTVEINHFVDVRALLPALPAIVILLDRAMPAAASAVTWRTGWPLPAAALFTLWVMAGDYTASDNARDGAVRAAKIATDEGTPFYFSGFGAFHFYAERLGGRPVDVESGGFGTEARPKMQHGELLAMDSAGSEAWRVPPRQMEEVAMHEAPNPWGVTTYHPGLETGFYNHMGGFLPYVIGRVPPERYGVYRWTGPSYVPRPAGEASAR
jgi:hypothetical protein